MYVCIYGTGVCKYNVVQFGLRVCVCQVSSNIPLHPVYRFSASLF